MKIALYFGSFNPIHIGHLIIAAYIADNAAVDQVWFVVSPQNPLKHSGSLLNEYHRLHLVQTAIQEDLRFKATDVEFKLPKPSYTIDTLTYLKEKYPANEFIVVMGTDSFQNISKWKNAEVLLKEYSFLLYPRPGFEVDHLPPNIQLVDAPLLQVSSTDIRKKIKEGKSIRYFVPDNVREEIERSGYYK